MKVKVLLWLTAIAFISVAFLAVSCSSSEPEPTGPAQSTPESSPSGTDVEPRVMSWDSPPPMIIDTSKKYTAIMETEKGTLMLELFAKDVPKTVNNFVFLANEGFYDGVTFHRVFPGFMAQSGDPTGTGMGGPGYRFEDEFTSHGHDAGALSMANSGANTNGSQFFICYASQHHLDGHHSVFGQLVEGMDVLESITPRDPSQNPSFEGDKIISVTIEVTD